MEERGRVRSKYSSHKDPDRLPHQASISWEDREGKSHGVIK